MEEVIERKLGQADTIVSLFDLQQLPLLKIRSSQDPLAFFVVTLFRNDWKTQRKKK